MQTRLSSFIESVANTASGFVLALIAWHFLAIAYHIPMPMKQNLEITSAMTVLSLSRSFVWRRLFNGPWPAKVALWLRLKWMKLRGRVSWAVITDSGGALRCACIKCAPMGTCSYCVGEIPCQQRCARSRR